MNSPVFKALIENGALLLALVALYVLFARTETTGAKKRLRQVVTGVAAGLLGIALMQAAYALQPGIIFDTRSVLLCLCGLFFGAVPVWIAMGMTAAFRLYQGGVAAWAGTAVIFATGSAGLLLRARLKQPPETLRALHLYLFGLVVHLIMLALMFLMPLETALNTVRQIGLPVLLIYPAAVLVVGLLLQRSIRQQRTVAALQTYESTHRNLFENNHVIMLLVDPQDGSIVDANPAACAFYGWDRKTMQSMDLCEINTLPPDQIRKKIEQVCDGQRHTIQLRHRLADGSEREVEVLCGPISIGGRELLYSIVHDITERKRVETEQADQIEQAQQARRALLSVVEDQKLAEAALQKSEENLRTTLNSIGDAVISTDIGGRVVSMNPVAESLTGWSGQQASGHPIEEVFRIINEQTRQTVESPVAAVLKNGTVVGLANHTLLLAKDGREIPIADSGAPIRNADGESTGVVLVFRDQTTERAARTALEESEARYRLLFENMTTGFAVHEMIYDEHDNPVDYRFLQVNAAFEDMTGLAAEKAIGRTARELLPATEEHWIQAYGKVALTGEPINFENYSKALDKHFEVRAFCPAPHRFAVVFSDITQRKEAEAELTRLSTAIEQSPETVVITNTEGIIQYVNPAFEKITGYSVAETIGKNPHILQSGHHDARFYSDLWETLRAGKTWNGRFINKRKDGSFYTEEAAISPVRDAGANITGYVAVKRNITAELEREEMFRQSQKMDSVGQLAGGIAHDFNNMLQAILGFAELLLEDLPGTSRNYQNAKEIKKAARRAAELTRKLLAFSRKQPVNKKEINLNDTVQDSEVLFHTLLGESIRLDLQLAGDLRPICADHGQLTQVIMNLAVNARDAMPDGGRLTIATDNVILSKEDTAVLPDVSPGGFVCLSVTDTGCGMPQEVQNHLFEPFFTTKAVGKGTGLGLAVVYGIVKQNKGWIHVYSEEGHGTSVKIYLPALTDKQTTAAGGVAGTRKNERVLLVEDDPDARDVVVRILKTANYQVTAVASAEEALACCTKESGEAFDLLFSDMVLPGKSGLELADALQEKNPGLPVLLYSGYRDQRERWESLDRKGYRFLQKPFTVSTLLNAVHETLGN
jgi:PAS domain S-box-containing protein